MASRPEPHARGGPGTPPRRLRFAVAGRLPGPLAALLVIVAIFGVAWALIVPPWQSPDEIEHFAYAQSLATRLALPGDPQRQPFSGDQLLADGAVGASSLAFNVGPVRPDWSAQHYAGYLAQARQHPSQSDGGGPNPQAVNPPLFYLYSDLAYWAASGSDNAFTRLYAMQLWGVLLLLANVVAAWLLAGEAFGRLRPIQLICAAVSGLVPMETFIATSVSPDAMMVPLWTFALWLGARVITRGARGHDAIALGAVTGAAILTKSPSYALVPAVLLALGLGWRRRPGGDRRAAAAALLAALAALVVPVLAWVELTRSIGRSAVNGVSTPFGQQARPFMVRQFISYVWQFYLPRLPSQASFREVDAYPAYIIWLREGWATFGWLDVLVPAWIYQALGALIALLGLAAARLVLAVRERRQLELLGFCGLALLALLGGLHLTDYRSIIAGEGPLLQGRYLLPVVGLLGLTVALVVRAIPPRWRGPAAGVILVALLLLQVLSLATVTKVYYT